MKNIGILNLIVILSGSFAQAQDPVTRGPVNTLSGGVVDGVVLLEEVPVRSKVEYEYVRASDYVWSKSFLKN